MTDLNAHTDTQLAVLSADRPTPLYYQLYSYLRARILDGTFAHGDRLPTENELALEYSVSRITSKRALNELAAEGLVERHRGKGTHVTFRFRPEPMNAPMVGTLQEVESIGRLSAAIVLDCRHLPPPPEIREQLALPPGVETLHLARVRHKDGLRFGYYRSWTVGMDLPEDPGVLETVPRMTYFRQRGLEVASIRQHITARAAGPDASQVLGVEPGSPLLSVTRQAFKGPGQTGEIVDFLHIVYHPTRFEYRIDLDLDHAL